MSDNSQQSPTLPTQHVKLTYNHELTLKERWEMAKRVIEHEHSLMKTRATRFLTIQGFLFSMVVALISAYFYNESQNPWLYYAVFLSIIVFVILWIVYCVAIASAVKLIDATDFAKRQTYYASFWFNSWCKYSECCEYVDKYKNGGEGDKEKLEEWLLKNLPEDKNKKGEKIDAKKLNEIEELILKIKPEEYWLDHHARRHKLRKNVATEKERRDNKEFQVYEKFQAYLDKQRELDNKEVIPDNKIKRIYCIYEGLKKCFPLHKKLFPMYDEELCEDHTKGGTSIGYARILIKAWRVLFLGIIIALVVHIAVCLYRYGKHEDIAPPRQIVVGNMQTYEKPEKAKPFWWQLLFWWTFNDTENKLPEPFQLEDKTPSIGKASEPVKIEIPPVNFHLFDNVKIDFAFRLEQTEKPDRPPCILHDCLDKFIDFWKTPNTPDEAAPAESVPETLESTEITETPETNVEEPETIGEVPD